MANKGIRKTNQKGFVQTTTCSYAKPRFQHINAYIVKHVHGHTRSVPGNHKDV